MPTLAGVFFIGFFSAQNFAALALEGIHTTRHSTRQAERGLLQSKEAGVCMKRLHDLQDSCHYSLVTSCCKALVNFTSSGCWCVPEVVREGGARLQSLAWLEEECKSSSDTAHRGEDEYSSFSCEASLPSGSTLVAEDFHQDGDSTGLPSTYAWEVLDFPHYVFNVTITHKGCNAYISIGAAEITLATWQLRLSHNGVLLYKAELNQPYAGIIVYGATDSSDGGRTFSGYGISLANRLRLIPFDMVLVEDSGSQSRGAREHVTGTVHEGTLRPTCNSLGACELQSDHTHKCICDAGAVTSGESCALPTEAQVYYVQPSELSEARKVSNKTMPQELGYVDDANYTVNVLGTDYNCTGTLQALSSIGISRCDEAAEVAASRGMGSVFTSEMEATLLASCALSCASMGADEVKEDPSQAPTTAEYVDDADYNASTGSLHAPFVDVLSALSATNASQSRALRLLPGSYSGTGNTNLYIGIGAPAGSSFRVFDLPLWPLEISSTRGSNHTVVDCMGLSFFMVVRGEAGWEGNVHLEGLTIQRCTMSDGIEFAMQFSNSIGEILMKDLVIRDCTGTMGVVYIYECTNVLVMSSIFARNWVRSDQRWNLPGVPDHSGLGGALYIKYSQAVIEGSTFTHNMADLRGGAIAAIGLAARLATEITLRDVVLKDNSAGRAGGGIYIYKASHTLLESVRLEKNALYGVDLSQARSGGALMVTSTQLEIRSAVFMGNRAYSSGGALRADAETDLQISDTVLKNNTCWGSGGALSVTSSSLSLMRSTVTGNQAEYNGGGLECIQSDIVMAESTVMDSNTAHNGGGMWVYSCEVTATGGSMTGNVAVKGGGAGQLSSKSQVHVDDWVWRRNAVSHGTGGALDVQEGSILHLTRNWLLGNAAPRGNGGGIFTLGMVNLTGSVVGNNTAAYGGAMSLQIDPGLSGLHGDLNTTLVTSVLNTSFEGNLALQDGAVFYLSASPQASNEMQPRLRSLEIHSNRADGGGSVLFADFGAHMSLPDCQGCVLGEDNRAAYSNLEGYATGVRKLYVAPHSQLETGGYPLQVPVLVDLVDLYNNTAVTADPSHILATISGVSRHACVLSGSVVVLSIDGVATFSNFILQALPGTSCTITLAKDIHIHTETTIDIRNCVQGEWFDGELATFIPSVPSP
ncbi:hypothetical protein CYMTET_20121 [Cymbomonas tetramitiformis]|uniref:Right handed beta helix domain-containing protein n=1 Tax=Cymbomonas tetramitiformis TaxID=36881 RepID=A0AAE0G4R3_9CHLO|nr:hypothetical protein CYMTET_20121 [Cymbomonas tetramitiformis]